MTTQPGYPQTLVISDLDGTLWDNSGRCHARTVEAVRHIQALEGVELLAATGRRRNSARHWFDVNGIAMPAVLLNGAVGYDFVAEELFHMITFDVPDLAHVLDVLVHHQLAPVAYLADTTAVAVEGVTTCAHHLSTLEGDLVWWSIEALAESDDVVGLSMLGIEVDTVQGAQVELLAGTCADVQLFRDHLYPPWSVMIAPTGINKQRGIDAWKAHRGWNPERVIAIGDAGNDIHMLAAADIAVAVADAFPEVVELADHRIGPPAEGGWAEVLDLI